jgi:hypothetical protein
MRNLQYYLAIFTITLITVYSCKKKDQPRVPSIYGMWKGKYSPDSNSSPSQDVIYRIDENNTFYVYNGADTSTATEKGKSFSFGIYNNILIENAFLAEYTYYNAPAVEFTLFAEEVDKSYKTFKGIWQYRINGQTIKGGDVFATKIE